MICRTLTDDHFVIDDACPDDIPDEAAELIAAALLEMIEADLPVGDPTRADSRPGQRRSDESRTVMT